MNKAAGDTRNISSLESVILWLPRDSSVTHNRTRVGPRPFGDLSRSTGQGSRGKYTAALTVDGGSGELDNWSYHQLRVLLGMYYFKIVEWHVLRSRGRRSHFH